MVAFSVLDPCRALREARFWPAVRTLIVSLLALVCMRNMYLDRFVPKGCLVIAFLVAMALYVIERGVKLPSIAFTLVTSFLCITSAATMLHAGAPLGSLIILIPCATMLVVLEAGEGETFWDVAESVAVVIGALSLFDLLTILLFPGGLYMSGLYFDHYLMGYKTTRTWLQVPAISMLAAVHVRRTGKIGWQTVVLYVVSLASNILTDSTMGTVGLLFMLFSAGIQYLGERRAKKSSTASENDAGLRLVEDGETGQEQPSHTRFFSVALVVALALLAFSGVFYFTYKTALMHTAVVTLTGKSATFHGRSNIWDAAKRLISYSPWYGQGVVTTSIFTSLAQSRTATSTHSYLLSLLLSGGLLGLGVIVAGYVLALYKLPSRRVTPANMCSLGLLANLFIGLTSCSTYSMLTLPLIAVTYRMACEERG